MSFFLKSSTHLQNNRDYNRYNSKYSHYNFKNHFLHKYGNFQSFSTEGTSETPTPPPINKPANLFEAFSRGINKYRNVKLHVPEIDPSEAVMQSHYQNLNISTQNIKFKAYQTVQSLPELPFTHLVSQKLNSLKNQETALIAKLHSAKRRPNEFHVAVAVYEEVFFSIFLNFFLIYFILFYVYIYLHLFIFIYILFLLFLFIFLFFHNFLYLHFSFTIFFNKSTY